MGGEKRECSGVCGSATACVSRAATERLTAAFVSVAVSYLTATTRI